MKKIYHRVSIYININIPLQKERNTKINNFHKI